MITSSIDGRLRAIAPGLEKNRVAGSVKRKLSQLPGVKTVNVNTLTGSLLVKYDSEKIHRAEVGNIVEALLISERRKGKRQGLIKRRSIRTIVNYSMLGSFAVSIAGVYMDWKKAHVYFGKVFVAALVVHLLQNDKGLLK